MFRSLFGTTIAGEDGGTGGDGSDAAKSSAARQPPGRQGQKQGTAAASAAAAVSATAKPKKGEKKVADRGGFFQLDPGHAAPGELHYPTHTEGRAVASCLFSVPAWLSVARPPLVFVWSEVWG